MNASQKSQKAQETSRLAALWLEHPFVAHEAHEQAASAHELEGNPAKAAEHRAFAEYWAKKEAEENNRRYGTRQN